MRRAHFLGRNAKNEMPNYIIFVDTETQPKELQSDVSESILWFGWCAYTYKQRDGKYSPLEWYRFTTYNAFWKFVISKTRRKTKVYVVAHNWGFDFPVLKAHLFFLDAGYEQFKAIIEGPPTAIIYRKDGTSICLLDTLNYFRTSLASLGDSLGIPKLEMPHDVDNAESWNIYCRRDVEVIHKALTTFIAFITNNDLGNFQLTLAAQSFTAFRHRFMHHALFIDNNETACNMSRHSYHGGRVECFHLGYVSGPLYYLDINSQYPHVMASNWYPTRLITVCKTFSLREIKQIADSNCVVVDVTIKTSMPVYPIRYDKKLIFPIGTFRTTLTTREFLFAIKHRHIIKTHCVAVYDQAPIFKSFVSFFYSKRLEFRDSGNTEFAYMTKILLNSLYGKFGQNGRIYQDIGVAPDGEIDAWDEIDGETGEVRKYRKFGGRIQEFKRESESYNSHPSIAAHIAADARMLLWDFILRAGYKNLRYCDTDSMLVAQGGFDNLEAEIDDRKIGRLKLVKVVDYAILNGPKDYHIGEIRKIKGIKSNAEQLDFSTFRQDQFVGFKGMIRRGSLDTQIIKRIEKNLTRAYTKGNLDHDGLILPIVLNSP